MSKVVTIPKDRNPFVVIVNGATYSYTAGEKVEVPDEVADVIEKYESAKPKPAPNKPSGSVQSDWNQTDSSAADFIKNKPFGDSPTGGDTLYWDGNTEGLVSVADFVYKVSDAVPTATDCAGGAVLRIYNSEGVTDSSFSAEEIVQVTDEILAIGDVYIIGSANAEMDGAVFPETGIYFVSSGGMYITSLTIPGYTGFPVTKKMEEKYLPEPTTFYNAFEDNYLYTDVNCTVKATAAELRAAMPNIVISIMGVIRCVPVMFYDPGTYAEVIVVNGTADGITAVAFNLYTAEYTPETAT